MEKFGSIEKSREKNKEAFLSKGKKCCSFKGKIREEERRKSLVRKPLIVLLLGGGFHDQVAEDHNSLNSINYIFSSVELCLFQSYLDLRPVSS